MKFSDHLSYIFFLEINILVGNKVEEITNHVIKFVKFSTTFKDTK